MERINKTLQINEKKESFFKLTINNCKKPFIKAAEIIKPKNTFEWVLLAIAVPLPLGVIIWVLIKSLSYKKDHPILIEGSVCQDYNKQEMAA